MRDRIGVGLLGCGIVGSAVARHLVRTRDQIERAVGMPVEVRRIAVRNLARKRDVPFGTQLFTHDPGEVVADPSVDLVIEVIGGIEPARSLMLDAIARGKPVVSANKELLSTLGRELLAAAEEKGVDLYFEAAVGGGIPLVRAIKEQLAGERVRKVMGIVNGTTNFILTRMSEGGLEFGDALAEAEALGYAEQDPTADIEGFDAAAKAAILASIAFRSRVVAGDVYREGISHITHQDIDYARKLGYTVKLLAIAEEQDAEIAVRVHPALLPAAHPLSSVRDSFNAVFVEGEAVGQLMFYGRGAGGEPTGTSVVGDVIAAARHIVHGGRGLGCTCYDTKRVRPIDEMESQFYVLLTVADRTGVLWRVAKCFADNDVSIKSADQKDLPGDQKDIVLVTHRAREARLQATVAALHGLDVVTKVVSVLRVEGEGEDA